MAVRPSFLSGNKSLTPTLPDFKCVGWKVHATISLEATRLKKAEIDAKADSSKQTYRQTEKLPCHYYYNVVVSMSESCNVVSKFDGQ